MASKNPVAKKPTTAAKKTTAPAKKPVAAKAAVKPAAKAPVKAPAKVAAKAPAKPAVKAPVTAAPKAPAKVAPKATTAKPVAPAPVAKAPTVKKTRAPSATVKSPAVLVEVANAPLTLEQQVAALQTSVTNLQEEQRRLRAETVNLLRDQTAMVFNVLEQLTAAQLQLIQRMRTAATAKTTVIKAVPDEEPGNINTVTIQVTDDGYKLMARTGDDPVTFSEVVSDEINRDAVVAFLNARKVKSGDVLHVNLYLL